MDALQLVSNRSETDVPALMHALGQQARASAHALSLASTEAKNLALRVAAEQLRKRTQDLLLANARDLEGAKAQDANAAFLDRLTLDDKRIEAIARGLDEIAALPDPVGRMLARYERPNGLVIERVATPLGVIGIIYESRPAVTADAGALCLKAGNAAILRGGSESFFSATIIHACLTEGLRAAGLPEAAVSLVPTRDRAAVGEMLKGLDGTIDVIVPRGGKSLVARVQAEARVPVFAHLEGVNHIFVHRAADLEKAAIIIRNAKLRRPGVCGAAEILLVDEACMATHLAPLTRMLLDAGCAIRGDAATQTIDPRVTAAMESDWRTEYSDAIIAVRVIDGLNKAIAHIETHGSHHTDCIITEDQEAADRFLAEVDSAIVMHNASTQFADGGEFGFGAEIGIATGRLHARGPVGLEQLTSFKYRVHGNGQIRP
ncbi:glutamate-5-semialdehyde dehydrogenase [Beijerinckia indica]|uniref:Gamma-glutamyl phosphate reductase n=1 Tax=Beijerinckia indica subsp. indica (strain ATCC 9039 / DSM 1715 / NCIMB 8712) TaxID=395963 RepID=PROA_BEII9|nr:glutamate-5-semialdehyde dehydrogenase [Beijerinckia indica]B2IE42.1 RecName: Full=Gamma-glutamyl phosphate reductase; Short=GPR; AltName: Full=Glutamate-5-semialdehyde dehydrogenase; AltName: Full=Glutamyl-gamma-semialdehyde dehydrogenase; Short=GSA dehydrogenase [Beijerinckia indica subsp. indica ATCC 9039]ACB94066.1 gamma-glutamyl phosphate reductase [Beijerinckia indica subsp. indica ATCC 9039]